MLPAFEKVLSLLSSMHVEYDATWPSRLGDESEREQIRAMLDGSIKEPFKEKQHQYVYRVETSVGPAYLKRTTYQSVRSILRHLLRRRCAHTSAGWEYLSTRAVQACGLPVVQPLIFGEQSLFGLWPWRGFVLMRAVSGQELADLLAPTGTPALRHEAFVAAGHYMGRLHGSGFFRPARFHDFLYQRTGDGHLDLIMIDLDFKSMLPIARPFDMRLALDAVAESGYLFLRAGRYSGAEIRHFFRGYKAGLNTSGQDFQARRFAVVVAGVAKRLAAHANDPKLRAMFPKTAPPLQRRRKGNARPAAPA